MEDIFGNADFKKRNPWAWQRAQQELKNRSQDPLNYFREQLKAAKDIGDVALEEKFKAILKKINEAKR